MKPSLFSALRGRRAADRWRFALRTCGTYRSGSTTAARRTTPAPLWRRWICRARSSDRRQRRRRSASTNMTPSSEDETDFPLLNRSDLRSPMTHLKLCILGATRAGKTSLVTQFVRGACPESHIYHPTSMVRIERKRVTVNTLDVMLDLWEIPGEDGDRPLPLASFLRGASGYVLVTDVTDTTTFDVALGLLSRILMLGARYARTPWLVVLNKVDQTDSTVLREAIATTYRGTPVVPASAIRGSGVSEAFAELLRRILARAAVTILKV